MVMTQVKSYLTATIRENAINVLEIDERLMELSDGLRQRIAPRLAEYGLELVDFFVGRVVTAMAPMFGQQPASPDGWSCSCGAANIRSRFCPECGAKKPEPKQGWNCPQCGKQNISSKFCPECGTKMPDETWDCPECGQKNIKTKFCPECGHKRNG